MNMNILVDGITYWVGATFRHDAPPKKALKSPIRFKEWLWKQLDHDEDTVTVQNWALSGVQTSVNYSALYTYAVALDRGDDVCLLTNN